MSGLDFVGHFLMKYYENQLFIKLELMLLRIMDNDTMYFYRDAEIIYGKVLSQKKARKRRKIGSSLADSTSTYPNEETSFRELNRNKV